MGQKLRLSIHTLVLNNGLNIGDGLNFDTCEQTLNGKNLPHERFEYSKMSFDFKSITCISALHDREVSFSPYIVRTSLSLSPH